MTWRIDDIAAALARGCSNRDRALADEQSPLGLDALDERDIHAVLALGLEAAGWGVHREVPYPGDAARGDNDRNRCDLVLTESPGVILADPVHAARRVARAEGTLFEPLAERIEADAACGAADPADAFWLEVKLVAQHRYRHGVPGPNRAYSAELVAGPHGDAIKLAADGVIRSAGIAVVAFTETDGVARHDLLAATHRLLDKDLPIGSPSMVSCPIDDRAGNASVTVAVFPLRVLGV